MDLLGIREGIAIVDGDGQQLAVDIQPMNTAGTSFAIRPEGLWTKGSFTVQISSRVIDLAANTLHRPFEMTSAEEQQRDQIVDKYAFSVR